jgi:hypothetical protein
MLVAAKEGLPAPSAEDVQTALDPWPWGPRSQASETFRLMRLAALLASGANLTADEACRLAFDDAVDEWQSSSVNVNGDVRPEKRSHPR